MTSDLKALRHEKEATYGLVVAIVGGIVWSLLVTFVVATAVLGDSIVHLLVIVFEIGVIVLVLFIAKLFFRAHLFGHAVLIGEQQFPYLHDSVTRGAQKLGMSDVPQTFLYNSNGLVNAFAARIAGRRMVLITSAIVDVDSEEQVDFVIGHELGHHAAGHLSPWKNLLKYPGTIVPFLGAAYHRSRELTADRIGAFCGGDYEAARGGLFMLACGSARLNGIMNADAFAAQEELLPPVTGFLLHIFSGYPRTTRRVVEVEKYFRGQGLQRPIQPSGAYAHS